MKQQKDNREVKKTVMALLLICTIMISGLAVGVLAPTAVAADLIIDLSKENGLATAAQLGAGGPARFEIVDQYDQVWGTDTEVEIFRSSYENDHHEITVAGENNEKVIAPGTENTYTFALRNNYGGYADYKVVVEAFFTGLEGTGKVIPVHARLKGSQGWLLGGENEYCPVLELDGVEESGVLIDGKHAMYTLDWQWPFEQDLNGDGNVDDGDALDTWLASQEQDISLTIRITTLAVYRDAPDGPDLPQTTPVPDMLDSDGHYAYLFGYEDGTIRPEAEVTRAQAAAIFFRLLKNDVRQMYLTDKCDYTDVAEDAWYRTEVSTLTEAGIVKGYSDGTYRGEQFVTRAELAVMLARLSERTIVEDTKTELKDIKDHWAEPEIRTVEDFSWVRGYEDGTFRPDQPITRAEAATMLNRMLHRLPEEHSDLLDRMNTWPDNADPEAWYYLAIQEATNSHSYARLLGTREKWIAFIDNPWESSYLLETP